MHGGADLTAPTVVDNAVRDRIAALAPRAPLHQARSLAALDAARRALPDVDHVACFDTAFHSTLTPAARTYALPEPWRRRWGLRRFGFHGISHRWAVRDGYPCQIPISTEHYLVGDKPSITGEL